MKTSYVIVDRATGKPVFETFNEHLIRKINVEKYEPVPILEWLQRINKQLEKN